MTEKAVGRGEMCAQMVLRSAHGYSAYDIAEIHEVTDPGYAERIARIDRAIAEAGPETTVMFEDETELRRFPP